MSIIHLVIRLHGDYDDYTEKPIMAFVDPYDANAYIADREEWVKRVAAANDLLHSFRRDWMEEHKRAPYITHEMLHERNMLLNNVGKKNRTPEQTLRLQELQLAINENKALHVEWQTQLYTAQVNALPNFTVGLTAEEKQQFTANGYQMDGDCFYSDFTFRIYQVELR